jgi:lipopolysaccharide/colanic/teichoic acid biosynthesis glycosyltransferase
MSDLTEAGMGAIKVPEKQYMQHIVYRVCVKRILDLFLACVLAIPALLLVGLCYVAIKGETHGPAFFVHARPGYKGRIFRIVKLRTMIVETERDGRQLSDMERITMTGKIVRALSLDELPQILNIFKGEMSFIGPRPLLPEYLPLYSKEQVRRHDVRPGISGWAQVNGRNEISWEHKFKRDVWYVDHMSFALDLKIFGMTIRNVLVRQGINACASDTMQEFTGNGKGVVPIDN